MVSERRHIALTPKKLRQQNCFPLPFSMSLSPSDTSMKGQMGCKLPGKNNLRGMETRIKAVFQDCLMETIWDYPKRQKTNPLLRIQQRYLDVQELTDRML